MATTHRPTQHDPEPVPEETDAERQQRAAKEEKTVRDTAEAAGENLPKPGLPVNRLSAADVAEKGEKMVRYLFAHAVTLTLPGYRMVHFPAGLQDVPESLANEHEDYFKNHNAVPAR